VGGPSFAYSPAKEGQGDYLSAHERSECLKSWIKSSITQGIPIDELEEELVQEGNTNTTRKASCLESKGSRNDRQCRADLAESSPESMLETPSITRPSGRVTGVEGAVK
jgi:hypothetical protein